MTMKPLLLLAATSLTLSSGTVASGADTASASPSTSPSTSTSTSPATSPSTAAQTKPPADSSSQTADQDKGGIDAKSEVADRVIEKFTQFYRQLKSFSLSMESDEETKAEGKSLKIHQTCQMKLERPNRASVRAQEPTVTQNLLTPSELANSRVIGWTVLKSDGKTIWMYKSDQNRFFKGTAPEAFASFAGLVSRERLMESFANVGVMCALSLLDDRANAFKATKFIGTETVDGVETQHVNTGGSFPVDLYIQSGEKSWLKQFIVNNKEAGATTLRCRYSNWQENPTIDAGEFDFAPPAGAKEVTSFSAALRVPQ